jgi:hypothetical protein
MTPNSAEMLNKLCACKTIDRPMLLKEMDEKLNQLFEARPNLFSSTTVFISQDQFSRMSTSISTIEKAMESSYFKSKALGQAPPIAQLDFGPVGVFTAYDFHLSDEGPFLIEINTNAGGALINLALAGAQEQCCGLNSQMNCSKNELVEMFLYEWKLQRENFNPELIAIVDENPETQYLYPEFLLFQKLFQEHHLKAVICDPSELIFNENTLWFRNEKVGMVYNRLTDFYLSDIKNSHLLNAYQTNAVVITPSPRNHALYANKANLELLSDVQEIQKMNLSPTEQAILLSSIPQTRKMTPDLALSLWEKRKELFFKPNAGFGSKAAYRGDKITKKVWEDILKNDYVAQKLIPPSKRLVNVDGVDADLKVDIRVYTYRGKIQLLAARLYEGQTTNFRTLGGGFAPVVVL